MKCKTLDLLKYSLFLLNIQNFFAVDFKCMCVYVNSSCLVLNLLIEAHGPSPDCEKKYRFMSEQIKGWRHNQGR